MGRLDSKERTFFKNGPIVHGLKTRGEGPEIQGNRPLLVRRDHHPERKHLPDK